MKTLIAVSRYLGRTRQKDSKFHFVGVYKGEEVKLIVVEDDFNFKKGEDYILYLKERSFCNGKLQTCLVSFKSLDDIFWS